MGTSSPSQGGATMPRRAAPDQAIPEQWQALCHRFRAMNTAITIEADPGDCPAEAVVKRFHEIEGWFRAAEAELSRFEPESSLSQLNRQPERWVVVPPLLFQAIRRALQAARSTGGTFDPTVLPSLVAAGYGRSFELGPTAVSPAPGAAGRWREIKTEPRLQAVWLPRGVTLDLGGIGKGLAADGTLERLWAMPGLRWALVNAGGDLALQTAPGVAPIEVQVADPLRPARDLAVLRLCRGAVATSSTCGRRWGEGLHHLIDPSTGRPAAGEVVQATVVAAGAARAEVLAKAALIRGKEQGLRFLMQKGNHGLLVGADGAVVTTPGMEGYLYGLD